MYMRIFLAAICILLSLNLAWLSIRSGFLGNTFLLNFGFLLAVAIYAVFYDYLKKKKWLVWLIAAFSVMYGGLGTFAMIYGRWDTVTFNEDVAIVLGSGLRGEEVSPTLRNRLDMAVEYHFRNPEAIIIVSGGQGQGDIITEALAMARYLENAGVPSELIIQEGRSHSTYENMRRSMEILEGIYNFENFRDLQDLQNLQDLQVVIITNDFHIFRSTQFARMVGMDEVTSFHGNTPILTLPGALVREVAAILKMWLIGT